MNEIITVGLTSDSSDALNKVQISRGCSKTDAVNRALQLSALVEQKCSEGFQLAFVKPDRFGGDADIEIVTIS